MQTGAFTVTVGGSSRDNRLQGSFQAGATGAVSNAAPRTPAGQPPATVSCPSPGTGGGTGGTPTATPEPGSGALYGTGLAALLAGLSLWRPRRGPGLVNYWRPTFLLGSAASRRGPRGTPSPGARQGPPSRVVMGVAAGTAAAPSG